MSKSSSGKEWASNGSFRGTRQFTNAAIKRRKKNKRAKAARRRNRR